MVKRFNSNSPPPAKHIKLTLTTSNPRNSNPLSLKPLGNLLFNPQQQSTRTNGLGSLSIITDEILLSNIFLLFDGEELCRISSVSRAFLAWSSIEGIWKGIYITKSKGKLLEWHGSWKKSYIATFLSPGTSKFDFPITTPTLHSDVLFQPHLCAAFDPNSILKNFTESIKRISGAALSPEDLPLVPSILTGLMNDWPALSKRKWDLNSLAIRFKNSVQFRAEATLTTLMDYKGYHDKCETDESPLYLFESDFVEKTRDSRAMNVKGDSKAEDQLEGELGMGSDYMVPNCFSQDLFSVLGSTRPDYRWLIVGPTRSGSTWHQDPNGTSAWNAVTVGKKLWICFPPDVIPPGVYVSDDMGEVEAPLSLAEWFISYYPLAKQLYGSGNKNPKERKMLEGICSAGEIFFIPSGWWHIVINLEPSIAVTQNFISNRELPAVLKFMKERPNQISGFKLLNSSNDDGNDIDCDALIPKLYETFCTALENYSPGITNFIGKDEIGKDDLLEKKEEKVVRLGLWEGLKGEVELENESDGGMFSFGFEAGELDDFDELEQ